MRRRRAALLAGLMPVLALSGCGEDPENNAEQSEDSRDLARAGEKTRAAKSARFELAFAVDGGSEQARITMKGATNTDRPGMSGTMTVDESVGANVPAGTTMRFVSNGKRFWFKRPGDRLWIAAPSSASSSNPNDLSTGLKTLGTVNDDAHSEGREDVRGESTVRYSATTDLKEYRDSLPESARDEYESGLDKYGLDKLPLKVWVSDDGLIRRFRYDITVEQGGQSGKLVATYDLFDFGKAKADDPPAADEVATSAGTP